MFLRKFLLLTVLVSVFLIFTGSQTAVFANTISVTDASVSDWTGVTRFNDGTGDANGSGDLDLIKFWVTSDATNIYCRWDIILSTNKSKIASAGYSIALTSIVPAAGSQPVAEVLAFVGFDNNGLSKVSLMGAGNTEQSYALANAQAVGSGAGATVSVEAKFSYADINSFIKVPNKFGPNASSATFPLWAQSHSSPSSVKFSTASVADRCPNMGYLSFNSTTGTSIPVGTGPFASIVASVSNPNTTPGGIVNYAVKVTNIGDTTGAPKLLFNQIKWALPNTGFTYISSSTTGLVTANPTQAAFVNSLGISTTNLSWPVTGSLAPGETTTLYFKATAQNTAATNLLSEAQIVAQTPNIAFDTGSVAPVNLNASYVTPATPINLVASNTTQTTTTLSWSASANAATYSVYDNGVLVQSGITGTSLNITGLSPSSTHNYTVKAISTYSIESSLSNTLQVITLAPYTVTFNTQGGSAVTGTTKLYNEKITIPTQPTRTGYTFGGWYKEASCTNVWNFETDVVVSNTTIYAKWTINSYTVTFQTNGGTTIPSRIVPYNSLITPIPSEPTKENYTFGGWFHDAEFTHVYDFDNFDNDDAITEDKTIYIKWNLNKYTVSFNAQNGIPFPGLEVDAGGKIVEPSTIPVKEGYVFVGWYVDTAYTQKWNFATDVVTHSFTMHAKWTTNSYSVTFQTNGGTSIASVNTDYGTTITTPVQPTKTGYTFGGWYKEAGFTNVWNFETDVVTANTTIYAKWTIDRFNVAFDAQGGSEVTAITADYNTIITAPTQPTWIGHTFDGWYKEANCANVWNFETDVVVSNTILYAKWIVVPQYTVTLNAGSNGTVVADPINATVYQGQTVTYKITPDAGYEIKSITYNNAPVFATNGTYTTPAITSNATLNVTFSLKVLVPPTIATSLSEKRNNITINVMDKSGNLIENKLFEKTHITYATISNPDNFTLISQGMILKEVATGRWVDLPIANKSNSGQFAVQLFGLGIGPEMGFKDGATYTLQSYLKYLDVDGVVRRVTIGEEKSFIWE